MKKKDLMDLVQEVCYYAEYAKGASPVNPKEIDDPIRELKREVMELIKKERSND